jgi:hypothetical protein
LKILPQKLKKKPEAHPEAGNVKFVKGSKLLNHNSILFPSIIKNGDWIIWKKLNFHVWKSELQFDGKWISQSIFQIEEE